MRLKRQGLLGVSGTAAAISGSLNHETMEKALDVDPNSKKSLKLCILAVMPNPKSYSSVLFPSASSDHRYFSQ